MLAMHPEYQQKVHEELCSLYPHKTFDYHYDDMAKLPYLNMFIKETMRLIPPVSVIGRDVQKDFRLNDNTILPAGVQIGIPIALLHRSKEVWGPQAHIFNPENFSVSNLNKIHSFAFIPMSKGGRNCIGKFLQQLYFIYIHIS